MTYEPEAAPATLAEMWLAHRTLRDAVDRMELKIAELSTEGCHVHATAIEEHAAKLKSLDSEVLSIRGQLAELNAQTSTIACNVTRAVDIATVTRSEVSRLATASDVAKVAAQLRGLVDHLAPSTKEKRSPFDV